MANLLSLRLDWRDMVPLIASGTDGESAVRRATQVPGPYAGGTVTERYQE
jgi:hypothetical protein